MGIFRSFIKEWRGVKVLKWEPRWPPPLQPSSSLAIQGSDHVTEYCDLIGRADFRSRELPTMTSYRGYPHSGGGVAAEV